MAAPTLKYWLSEHTFSLALSSCYFGFYAHVGALSALEDHQLIPDKISGASAGALAGTMWASGHSTTTLHTILMTLKRSTFWDPRLGAGLLKGEKFRATVTEITGIEQLENCTIPLALSAFDCFSMSTHSVSHGNLANAVYASCTVPFLFQPLRIDKALYFDGGIRDWAGCKGLNNANRVLHIGLYNKQRYLLSRLPCSTQRAGKESVGVNLMNLTTVSPFSMHLGKVAFQQARLAMLQALEQPVESSLTISCY